MSLQHPGFLMGKGLLAKLGLAAASALVTLGLCIGVYEWRARRDDDRWRQQYADRPSTALLAVASENETLGWEYRPNAYLPERDLRTNAFGFRERPLATTDKPVGVYRVAFVGDSITLGLKAGPEAPFSRHFEADANAERPAGPVVQALNFGIDGYHTLQVAELTRVRTLAYEPDAVVYTLCMNDFDFFDSSGLKHRYFKKPRSFSLQRWRLFRLKTTTLEFHVFHFRRNKHDVFQAVTSLARELEARDIDFRVAVLPAFFKVKAGFVRYPLEPVHREIIATLEQRDIPTLDLLPAFAETGLPTRGLSFDIWHPNETGHHVISKAMLDFVPLPPAAPSL